MNNFKELNKEQNYLAIKFDGDAVADNSISINSFITTLVGLEKLSYKTVENLYGKKCKVELKVKALKPGSFIIDLLVTCAEPARIIVENIVSVIELGKFLMGKNMVAQTPHESDNYKTYITNCNGQIQVFNNSTVNIWNDGVARTALDKATSPLDGEGVNNISITSPTKASSISKSERDYFVNKQDEVINENESNVILEIFELSLSGNNKKWRFSDGEVEFSANIEDNDFLDGVKNQIYSFKNGTQLDVVLRTVQKKGAKIKTERTIIEVKKVIYPE